MNIFNKILTWLRANLGSILGIAQAALKAVKEILTAIVNFLSLITPAKKAQEAVEWLRDKVNWLDGIVEDWKEKILATVTNL